MSQHRNDTDITHVYARHLCYTNKPDLFSGKIIENRTPVAGSQGWAPTAEIPFHLRDLRSYLGELLFLWGQAPRGVPLEQRVMVGCTSDAA